jgi:hypothetical protein
MKRLLLIFFLGLSFNASIKAQPYLYFSQPEFNGQWFLTFYYLDLATCSICEHFTVTSQSAIVPESIVILPDGNVLIINNSGLIEIYQPPSGNVVNTFNVGSSVSGAVLAPNGNLYYFKVALVNNNYETCLYEFNLTTGNETLIGCEENYVLVDPYYWNGTFYAFGYSGPSPAQNWGVFSVTPGDPLGVTLEGTLNNNLCSGATAAIPGVGIFSTTVDPDCNSSDLVEFTFPNNTTPSCDLGNLCFCYGASAVPSNFPPPPNTCACITEVGEISSMDTILCTNEILNISNTGSNLDSDDVIEYLLFSDLTDTLGSIIQTSTTPSFSFSNPPLTEGVTYYVVAIAGNELPGGGVDLTDICLDFSNVISVVWNPLPTVDFAVSNPNVCEGECTEVEVILIGTPPFSLTYDTPGNSGQIETFTSASGTLTICIPSGSPPGSFNLQAVSLTDANCVCE